MLKAINSTKLAVTFNKEVTKDTAEKLENYYIGLTKVNVSDSSVAALNNTDYKATLQPGNKTVIIEGTKPEKNVIWVDEHTAELFTGATALKVDATNTVVKNKTVFVQVRNVKDASGKLMDTQEVSFKAEDTTPATLFGAVNNTDKKHVATKDNVTKHAVTEDKDTYFVFDEPVQIKNVNFFLDSRNITTNVELDATDKSGKTIKVDKLAGLKDLAVGDYVFEAVGVQDLAGNKVEGDIQTAILQVVDPAEVENVDVAPTVQAIDQTEEGTFKVTFAAAPKDGTKIVVKDAEGNTVKEHPTTGGDLTEDVEFATNITNYVNSTELRYTVEVTGADGGKIEAAASDKKADKYKKVHSFNLDLTAPTVKYETKTTVDGKEVITKTAFVNATNTQVIIPFEDKPFDSKMALATSAPAQDIIIKQHVGDETKTLVIPFTELGLNESLFNESKGELTLGIVDLVTNATDTATQAAAKALLNKDETALVAGEYEVTLPRGLVTDTDDKKVANNTRVTPFAGDVIKFTVTEEAEQGGVSVPQTAQDLVEYDEDHDAVIVKFVGEDIDAKSAKNPANYTIAGKALAADTVIEYETSTDILGNGTDVAGAEVRIFLKDDTIARDGNYSLTVQNVATKGGAKMLPTAATVYGMKDNTLPVLTSAVITGNAKIELTFSESVVVETGKEAAAAANFSVAVNGAKYNAATATAHATNDKVIIVELNDTIEYAGKTVTVTTQADQNGDVFVTDKGLNKLKLNKMVTATVKQ